MKTKLYMKIISFILVLTMLFSLVACSSTPEDPSASNPYYGSYTFLET